MVSNSLHIAKFHNQFSIPTVLELSVAFGTFEHFVLLVHFFTWLYFYSDHWQELVTWFPPTCRKTGKVWGPMEIQRALTAAITWSEGFSKPTLFLLLL